MNGPAVLVSSIQARYGKTLQVMTEAGVISDIIWVALSPR